MFDGIRVIEAPIFPNGYGQMRDIVVFLGDARILGGPEMLPSASDIERMTAVLVDFGAQPGWTIQVLPTHIDPRAWR